jgi:hypothetical protein
MTLIPERQVSLDHLREWYELKKQMEEMKNKEIVLRQFIFAGLFPSPEEGTNSHPLNDGTGAVLKAVHTINRAVQIDLLQELAKSQSLPDHNLPKLELEKLVKWKPEVAIKEYRTLTDEQRNLFDQVLVIKPGMPGLDIVIPKRST